jgi:hypothetical protein
MGPSRPVTVVSVNVLPSILNEKELPVPAITAGVLATSG